MKKKKIPKFKSEQEEAFFWDTHSPLNYQEDFTDIKEPFEFSSTLIRQTAKKRKKVKRMLTLRMDPQQIDIAKIIAKRKGCGYQTQMRMWVVEGIRKEIKEHPEIRKLIAHK